MSSSQPQRPVWSLRLGFKVRDPIWFRLKPHSFRCDVWVACVLWTDDNLTAVSLSVLSSPPMAVIRFTSQLWVWMACPRLWSCPLVHRSPELPVCLTQLVRGHTNRLLEDGGWFGFWSPPLETSSPPVSSCWLSERRLQLDRCCSLLDAGDATASFNLFWVERAVG